MDRIKEIFGAERVKESDPRMVEGILYQNPIGACIRIEDIIQKIFSSGKPMSDELQEQCFEVFELIGEVRDLSHIKNTRSGRVDNSQIIISLAKGLKKLIDSDEFLSNFDSLSFKEAKSDYSWMGDNFQNVESKEDLKKILKGYFDLLNHFALENYPASPKAKH